MENVLFLIIGSFLGLAAYQLPAKLWLKKDDKLNKEAFKIAFPQKMKVYYLYVFLPFAWMVIYLILIFPGIFNIFKNSNVAFYFVCYLLFGGFGILDGILEILSGISPIRQGGRARRSLRLYYLVVNESVRRVGLLRIGVISGVGILSWLIILVMG